MPNKHRVRTLMDSQRVKGSKTLLKFVRQGFDVIFWSLQKNFFSKNFVSVVSEILGHSVNILTLDDSYSLSIKVIVEGNQLKHNYLQNTK